MPIAKPFRHWWLLVAVLCCLPALAADHDTPGYALPLGGAVSPDNAAIWNRLVTLAGGKGAHVLVIAIASENPERAAASAVDALARHGAIAEYLPLPARAPAATAGATRAQLDEVARINAATGIFFTGGAQGRITDALMPGGTATPVLEAIRALQARGGVVAGTSAGAAIMSAWMFLDPPEPLAVMQHGVDTGRDVSAGLGFVGPGVFVDQHFLRRGRIGRMLRAMQAAHIPLGIGVDEDSGAIVHGRTVEAIGARGIVIADIAAATTDATRGAFNLHGVQLYYLEQGDRFDLDTRRLQPSAPKQAGQSLDPQATTYAPYYPDGAFYADILGDNTLATAMARLLDSSAREVRGLAFAPQAAGAAQTVDADLGFEFRLYKGPGTRGWLSTAQGGTRYTLASIYLDIEPVRMAHPLHVPWHATP